MKRGAITSFFKPIATCEVEVAIKEESHQNELSDQKVCASKKRKTVSIEENENDAVTSRGNSFSTLPLLNDIGEISTKLFACPPITSNTMKLRNEILTDVFVPNQNYVFPVREINKKKLRFQLKWLDKWPWLAYSQCYDGAFCKYCVLFCNETVGKGSHQKIGSLVAKPFIMWKDAVEKFNNHSRTSYHKLCEIAGQNFLKVSSGKSFDIKAQIVSQRKKEVDENRAALIPIIETVIFCGEQEISLRGDEDSGMLSLEKPEKNDGNFRALLRFRANSGDLHLKDHILNCKKNATYISPKIQNEILEACGTLIRNYIVKEANSSGFFSILADETLDISGVEQFSLCVRYVNSKNNICEGFLGFIAVFDLSSEGLTTSLLNQCQNLGLQMDKLVGQGYDGASNMRGQFNGVQAKLKNLYPKAIYVHCASHRLNLALSSELRIPYVRNCHGTISEICNLFRNNSYAGDILKTNIRNCLPESRKSRLLKVCETRFVERHDAIIVFVELFEAVVVSLQELSESDRQIASNAQVLLSAIDKSYFLISLLVCEKLLSFTLNLSLYLQNPAHDLVSALEHAKNVVAKLQELRKKADENFKNIYNLASGIAHQYFNSEIRPPRVTKKQTNRDNPEFDTAEEYYRRTIFLPCLDLLIEQLNSRFEENKNILSAIEIVIPANCKAEKLDLLENLSIYYENECSIMAVKAEFLLWCEKWKNTEKVSRPKNVLEALDSCDAKFFPNIHNLIKILCTLPISTASAERSFSTMKRVKTFVRNRTGHERLSCLALLSVHRNVPLNPEDVLNKMALKQRRLDFIL